jgi:hypothetical protein
MIRSLTVLLLLGTPALSFALPGDPLFSVVPDAPQSSQDFGDAVALAGSLLVVGAEDTADGAVLSAGAAYLFDAATGAQIRKLVPNGPPITRQFGTSVATDGTLVVAGSEDENANRGAAYLFNAAGIQLHRFEAADGASGDEFGQDVAVRNGVVAVSSPNAGSRGAVYLFNATTGAAIGGAIRPDDLPFNAEFGSRIDMDSSRLIVAMDNFEQGGAAYVYTAAGLFERKLVLPPVFGNPVGFGRSVAISGNVALVGATPGEGAVAGEQGAAFLFDLTTGDVLHRLAPSESLANDLFGEDVALSGKVAVVTSRREVTLGLPNTAFLFDVTTGRQVARLDGAGIAAGSEAFEAVAIDGGRILVGHEGFDAPGFTNNGRAIVFDALVADYDRDDRVAGGDLLLWQRQFGSAGVLAADGDRDGKVDGHDLAYWQGNFGVAAPAGFSRLAAIPEPASYVAVATILVLGIAPRTARRITRPTNNAGPQGERR